MSIEYQYENGLINDKEYNELLRGLSRAGEGRVAARVAARAAAKAEGQLPSRK